MNARAPAAGFMALVAFAVGSCDGARLPTTPAAPAIVRPAAPPSPPSITLSGVVFDHTSEGPQPRANLRLMVGTTLSGASWSFMEATTDAAGRYSLSGVPSGMISISPAPGSGYYAPCPAGYASVLRSDRVFDVHVVAATLLSTTGAPNTMAQHRNYTFYGEVFQRTPEGNRPIAGATVRYNPESDPRTGSTTLTDASGRYLVCPAIPETGTDVVVMVEASRDGFWSGRGSVWVGWHHEANIELFPK